MAGGEATQLALALHQHPARHAEYRRYPLPADVTEVLRLASGQAEALAAAQQATGVTEVMLRESARFYVEQQLLSREFDDDYWRVLGVQPGASEELLREHRRLLVGLVHPDRSEDWDAAFADRVNRAWRALKSAEGRAAAMPVTTDWVGRATPTPRDGATEPTMEDEWSPTTSQRAPVVGDLMPTPLEPILDDLPAPPRSRLAAIAGSVAVVAVVIGLGWPILFPGDWAGNEVLVPMHESVDSASGVAIPSIGSGPATGLNAGDSELAERFSGDPAPDLVAVSESTPVVEAPPSRRVSVAGPAVPGPTQSTVAPAPPRSAVESVVVVAAETPPTTSRGNESSAARQAPAVAHTAPPTAAPVRETPTRPLRVAEADAVDTPTRLAHASAVQPPPGQSQPPVPPADVVAAAPSTPASPRPSRPAATPPANETRSVLEIAAAPPPNQRLLSETNGARPGTSAPPSGLTAAGTTRLLNAFSTHYASGNLSSLIALFSQQANSANGGTMALAADYSRLFETTREREISISQVAWKIDGNVLRGGAKFEARYHKQGRLFRQSVRGQIVFAMVVERGELRILRLDSLPEGGRS